MRQTKIKRSSVHYNIHCCVTISMVLFFVLFYFVNIRRCLFFVSFLFVNFNWIIDLQPSGPIYLTEGDPIDIPCTLDDTEHYTIDDLELLYNRKSLPSEVIVIILFFINLYHSGRDRIKFWRELLSTDSHEIYSQKKRSKLLTIAAAKNIQIFPFRMVNFILFNRICDFVFSFI